MVDSHQIVGHSHIPIQNGVFTQHLPLVIVHRTRQDGHRTMVTNGVVEFYGLVFIFAEHIPHASKKSLASQHGGILAVDYAIVLVVGINHLAAIVGCRAVAEETCQQFAQCVGLLLEGVERVETIARHIEIDSVAQNRGRQWLTVACEYRTTARIDRVGHEDTLLQSLGIVGHLATKCQHPDKSYYDAQTHKDKESIDLLYPREHLGSYIYFASLFCHIAVSPVSPAGDLSGLNC